MGSHLRSHLPGNNIGLLCNDDPATLEFRNQIFDDLQRQVRCPAPGLNSNPASLALARHHRMNNFRPYTERPQFTEEQSLHQAQHFCEFMQTRRTVRTFSSRPVSAAVVDHCLQTALAAPSGANQQPWSFVVVESTEKRRELRIAAEREEQDFYERRAPEKWLQTLQKFDTDANKPFLETAPVVIAIFSKPWSSESVGEKHPNYYVSESVGIAVGFLIAALHHAGLSVLTHTPSPMKFLCEILNRPPNERPYLLLVAGYADDDCKVPNISRRGFHESVQRI